MANPVQLGGSLRVASHNTQGLNSPIKRLKAFQHYHSQGLDILLLQETHFPGNFNPVFLHHKFPTIFLANAEVKKRGVAIIFSKTVSFSHSQMIKDREGHYILVKGHIDGCLYTFISYYAPNIGQAKFFSEMLLTLSPHFEGWLVMDGNSNIAFDQHLS